MPKVTKEFLKCNRCNLYIPETWFKTYKYKDEIRRLKHCKMCNLKKGEKLPTETWMEKWLKEEDK